MGERTVSKAKRAQSTSRMPGWWQGTDGAMIFAVAALVLWGLVMVYSTTPAFLWRFGVPDASGKVDTLALFRRQASFVALGVISATMLAAVDYHRWERLAPIVLLVVWAGLLLTLVMKHVAGGTGRFLFGGSYQPSEIAKVATVFYLSVWLSRRKHRLGSWVDGAMPLAVLVGVTAALVLVEPDMSAAMTIFALGMILYFLAGGSLRQLALFTLAALLAGGLLLLLYPVGAERMSSFLAGLSDPKHASYQIKLSIAAISRGGWFGVGPGQSEIKVSGLPLAHTDSVFAVVAEEYGVVGAALMVVLFGIVVLRGIRIALHAPDDYGRLLAGGLALWLGIEAYMNMAMMLGMLPLAGNTLPFISYGGSSLVTALSAVGLILSVGRASAREQSQERSDTGAVVSLRRGNRRRRVSRAVGTSSLRR